MNFEKIKKIKKDYPKTWELLVQWFINTKNKKWNEIGVAFYLETEHNSTRHLYDFFDEQGIYGYVAQNGIGQFIAEIRHKVDEDPYCPMWQDIKETRPLAEEELFTKEFEMLNQKQ